jgi:hypothetical protein
MNDLNLVMVGVDHSSIRSQREMPSLDVDGEIEIFPSYAEALEEILSSSKLITVNLQIKYVNY